MLYFAREIMKPGYGTPLSRFCRCTSPSDEQLKRDLNAAWEKREVGWRYSPASFNSFKTKFGLSLKFACMLFQYNLWSVRSGWMFLCRCTPNRPFTRMTIHSSATASNSLFAVRSIPKMSKAAPP